MGTPIVGTFNDSQNAWNPMAPALLPRPIAMQARLSEYKLPFVPGNLYFYYERTISDTQ